MTSVAHGFAFTTAVAAQNDLATKTIEMTAGGLVKSAIPKRVALDVQQASSRRSRRDVSRARRDV